MQSSRGFTLVELIVTIAVIAILAIIAAPSMVDLIAKQRLNSTARDLSTTLNQARSQAALLRREIKVTLNDSSKNEPTLLYWNPSTDSRLTSSITTVIFKADGTVKDANSDTNFVICNSKAKKTKTIILARTGTVSMGAEAGCT